MATAIRPTFSSGSVELLPDRLQIRDWVTYDEDVIRHFEDRATQTPLGEAPDFCAELARALKVGVIALRGVPITVNIDYVQREIQRQIVRLEEAIDEGSDAMNAVLKETFASEDGQLARELKTYFGQGGRLAALFDPNLQDSAITRIREMLKQSLEGRDSKLGRLLDHTNPDGPIYALHQDTHLQLNSLRKLVEDYRKEVAEQWGVVRGQNQVSEKGTLKGRDFQESVFDQVAEMAKSVGDQADATWDLRATNGTKAGDMTITIRDRRGPTARFVIEAKDGPVGLTAIARELELARVARQASAGIAVYSKAEHMPRGSAPFLELGAADFMCLLDKAQFDVNALRLAYHAARRLAINSSTASPIEVDTAGMRDDIRAARALLRGITTMKSQLSQLAGSVTKVTQGVVDELGDLKRTLGDLFVTMESRIAEEAVPPSTD